MLVRGTSSARRASRTWVKPGTTVKRFRRAIEAQTAEQMEASAPSSNFRFFIEETRLQDRVAVKIGVYTCLGEGGRSRDR